jgi:AbrB family looped-hinge helix DNA binding protein
METPFRTKIGSDGRIMIPAALRKDLQLAPGEELVVSRDEDGIHLRTLSMAIDHARRLVAQYIPPGTDLVAELRAGRKAEAAAEQKDGQ